MSENMTDRTSAEARARPTLGSSADPILRLVDRLRSEKTAYRVVRYEDFTQSDADRRAIAEFVGWHPWARDAARPADIALACEQAGRDAPRNRNSDGASDGSSASLSKSQNASIFPPAWRSISGAV